MAIPEIEAQFFEFRCLCGTDAPLHTSALSLQPPQALEFDAPSTSVRAQTCARHEVASTEVALALVFMASCRPSVGSATTTGRRARPRSRCFSRACTIGARLMWCSPYKSTTADRRYPNAVIAHRPQALSESDLYMQLSKSRLTLLVTIAAAGGYTMAPGVFELSTFLV